MALTGFMLLKVSHKIKQDSRVASMGYPDILASPKVLEQILGSRAYQIEYRKDSESICKRHGMNYHLVPDAASVFRLMGAELDVFDVIKERGCEIIADLNYPIVDEHLGQYDVVMDVGTLEHCFNIAQAGMNMAGLLGKTAASSTKTRSIGATTDSTDSTRRGTTTSTRRTDLSLRTAACYQGKATASIVSP